MNNLRLCVCGEVEIHRLVNMMNENKIMQDAVIDYTDTNFAAFISFHLPRV